jgi:hypothetical protein
MKECQGCKVAKGIPAMIYFVPKSSLTREVIHWCYHHGMAALLMDLAA